MTDQVRKVEGTVAKLSCTKCRATFPHFIFSGEDDTDTAGLGSLSSCDKNEIVIGELEPSEWNNFDGPGSASFEERLSVQLGRRDLRVVRLLRVERDGNVGLGKSFSDFRKAYKSPKLVFSCACCADGEARPLEEITVEDFKRLGGKISAIGHLGF